MKEQDLIDLNFDKIEVSREESGCDDGFYYYTYDFKHFSLITTSNDEILDDNSWYVEIFEYEDFRFTDKEDLEKLIELLETNRV
jgi:hypothetical protein